MPHDMAEARRSLIRLGRERGYVTHDEVGALPHAREGPELVEDVMAMFDDMGIHVVPAAPEGGGGAASPPAGT